MSLRWCMVTTLLLLAVVGYTLLTLDSAKPEPGITRRWWDDTLEKVEDYNSNGSLRRRTYYGEDGQSVLRDEEYHWNGNLRTLGVRLPDGNMEITNFNEADGKTIIGYVLENPDRKTLISRYWYANGKMRDEQIMSPDAKIPLETRHWFEDGSLSSEEKVLPTGEIQRVAYWKKDTLKSKSSARVNGTSERTDYHPDGKTVKMTQVATADTLVIDRFTADSKLWLSERHDTTKITFTKFGNDGKALFTQLWKPTGNGYARLTEVDEFDANGKLTRKLIVDGRHRVRTVHRYREDGSLSSTRHLRLDSSVAREEFFDEKGTAGETKEYGDTELLEEIKSDRLDMLQEREDE